ncbi:2-phosphosulfolactate phosphatase [Saccharopolyspora dendranthemae]|uniref:Probable 2-phosphosulfolactate phosphatase n=1 Tax=Saccharopolyspora dendranthemae TaxID=1181886 RepID=A0A561U7I6_9PSEU|nr:2-phosphosulfolactate phosphatase [Saccharopolyspora dendranthemae]TWF95316.1 2-phosphosulfolactate phosphatase [Saccharopolyspora dendranthemae]
MPTTEWAQQSSFGVRFDWGASGAEVVSSGCLVIVDVLSFTTSVTVAVERGTRVFPYRWRDSTAGELAAREEAELAVGRSQMSAASPWSLSPAALRLAPFTERLVLPSPNGSTIASSAGDNVTVVAGCLRNATATGHGLTERGWGTAERPVSVIAAGERWPDGGLRPAVEDLLGAGAVIAALHDRGRGPLSPEASAALAAFRATEDVRTALARCASGQELITSGYADDVAIAAELDVTGAVPVLSSEAGFGHAWA